MQSHGYRWVKSADVSKKFGKNCNQNRQTETYLRILTIFLEGTLARNIINGLDDDILTKKFIFLIRGVDQAFLASWKKSIKSL